MPTIPRSKKSLVSKLAVALNQAGPVKKRGHNQTADYQWLQACDLFAELRNKILAQGILILPEHLELTEEPLTAITGVVMRYTRLKVRFDVIDGRTDETLSRIAWGTALDAGDKGLAKAETAAFKGFLKRISIIADPGDDPEADERTDIHTDPSLYEKEFDKRTRGQRTLTEKQITAFNDACALSHKTEQQRANFLKTKFSVLSITELTRANFQHAIKWASRTEADYTSTLETSVQSAEAKKPNGHGQPIVKAMDVTDPEEQLRGD
jgi:hypothetical protein